jgi:hypothetical protein
MPDDIEGRLNAWLKESGFILEMTVARGLAAAGFEVLQADYHEDIETKKLGRLMSRAT